MIKFYGLLATLLSICIISFVVWHTGNSNKPEQTRDAVSSKTLKWNSLREAMRSPPQDEYSHLRTSLRTELPLKSAQELSNLRESVTKGQWQSALLKLENLAKRHPESPDILMEIGLINLMEKSQPLLALDFLKSAVRLAPEDLELLEVVIQLFTQLRIEQSGLKFLQELSKENSELIHIKLGIAKILLAQGNFADTILALKNVKPEDSLNSITTLELRARAYRGVKNWEASRDDFTAAVSAYKTEINRRLRNQENVYLLAENLDRLIFDLIDVLLKLEDYEQASQFLDSLAERHPADHRVITLMEQIFQDHQIQL